MKRRSQAERAAERQYHKVLEQVRCSCGDIPLMLVSPTLGRKKTRRDNKLLHKVGIPRLYYSDHSVQDLGNKINIFYGDRRHGDNQHGHMVLDKACRILFHRPPSASREGDYYIIKRNQKGERT
jgi:hypothetical protein